LETGPTLGTAYCWEPASIVYDVAFISGIRNPSAIGFKTDEILRIITIDES
jgi:hypothetical protein